MLDLELIENEKIDTAIGHFENSTQEELFGFLDGEDDILKQISLLHLKDISSQSEAEKIVHTLVNHPSETREYCSFLINRLMKRDEFRKYFEGEKILDNIERAIYDVNPKVCRKIIEILPYFIQLDELYPRMIKNSFELVEQLAEKNKDKNYLYNKKSFHLYWHVFALGYTLNKEYFLEYKENLLKLLELLLTFKEYTLREKGAYLLLELRNFDEDDLFLEIFNKYNIDDNFYVKEILI